MRRQRAHPAPGLSPPRASVAVAVLGALSLLAAGCGGDGGGAGGKTEITFASWAYAEDATKDAVADLVRDFEKEHPDIDVKMQPEPFTDIAHNLLQQAQSGDAPDVAQTAGNDMFVLADAGLLLPLDGVLDDAYKKAAVPSSLELGRVEGEQLAVPWTVAPSGFWYNKKLLRQAGLDPERPPQTLDDLVRACETIRQELPDVIPLGLDSTNRSFGLDVNWPLMQSFDGTPFAAEGGPRADSPGMHDYLEFMRTLAKNRCMEVNQKIGDARPRAADGKVAFLWDGPYLQGVIQSVGGMSDEEFYDTWGVTSLPTGPSGEPHASTTDHQLAVFSSSGHQQEAWELIEYLSTSQQGLAYVMGPGASMPAVAEPGGRAAELADTPVFDAYREDVLHTVGRPPWGPAYAEAYSSVMAGVQSAMTGGDPVADIASRMNDELATVLE